MKTKQEYGTWPSIFDAQAVAKSGVRLAEPKIMGEYCYWLESRPFEKGRCVIVEKQNTKESSRDVIPSPWSVRSKAHEYGGGAYCITPNTIFFVNAADQNIYQIKRANPTAVPSTITHTHNYYYADLCFDHFRECLFAVCESHRNEGEPKTFLVRIDLSKSSNNVSIVAEGCDFYSNPKVSPEGKYLSWLSWNHPHMPWQSTQLSVARLSEKGDLTEPKCIAGSEAEQSIFQPQWSPSGSLFWVSDKNNWWNIYSCKQEELFENNERNQITFLEAEFATPQWVFGMSTYGFLNASTLLATYTQNGEWKLAEIDLNNNRLNNVNIDCTAVNAIDCQENSAAFIGASPCTEPEVFFYQQKKLQRLTEHSNLFDKNWISKPKTFSFPTTDNEKAKAFYYAPCNPNAEPLEDTKPPVIVIAHGGPTGATTTQMQTKIQFWTSRGFAVIDVNYRGSTGYGRKYRDSLNTHWGIKDVDDLCRACEYAADQGWVDSAKKIVKGSSAGGFSVLAALTFRETFDAGTSLYGISDLEALATDTHKFEAHYLDSLVGPYPQFKSRYRERSPIHAITQLKKPILVLQGGEDKVVPPNQAERIVNAAKTNLVPVAYAYYPAEGHGFRQAETLIHSLEAELYFYQKIFGLECHAQNPPIMIENF